VNCNDIIEQLYNNDKINQLISKIQPSQLQDDLKQELAIVLLEYDCDKLKKISREGNIIGFAMQIIWTMGTSNRSPFYNKYRKNEIEKAFEYINSQNGNSIPFYTIQIAEKILQEKLKSTPSDAHESIIFNKYVEMRSCIDVAKYFDIPKDHVFAVVKKMKRELKKAING
jgi:uncharacterized protein with HEPN domain